MERRLAVLAVPLVLGLGGCAETPVAPEASRVDHRVMPQMQGPPDGTGLVLESLTGVEAPLVGQVGEVTINEAIITDLLIDEVAGQIVGIEAQGILEVTGGVLGTDVVTQEFTTTVDVISSGPGQCEVITIELGPIAVDAPLGVVTVDVPEATLAGRGSGAVGSLLCTLGRLLEPVTGTIIPAVRGIVNAINNLI